MKLERYCKNQFQKDLDKNKSKRKDLKEGLNNRFKTIEDILDNNQSQFSILQEQIIQCKTDKNTFKVKKFQNDIKKMKSQLQVF